MTTFLYTLIVLSTGYFVRWFQEQVRNAPIIEDDEAAELKHAEYLFRREELRDKAKVSGGFPRHGGCM
jgi:hypothetical protein